MRSILKPKVKVFMHLNILREESDFRIFSVFLKFEIC